MHYEMHHNCPSALMHARVHTSAQVLHVVCSMRAYVCVKGCVCAWGCVGVVFVGMCGGCVCVGGGLYLSSETMFHYSSLCSPG